MKVSACPSQKADSGGSQCGERHGFGTCDKSTGECGCALGWTGNDCSDATCCPIWVFVFFVVVLVMTAATCAAYRYRRLFRTMRHGDDEHESGDGVKTKRGTSILCDAGKSSSTVAAAWQSEDLPADNQPENSVVTDKERYLHSLRCSAIGSAHAEPTKRVAPSVSMRSEPPVPVANRLSNKPKAKRESRRKTEPPVRQPNEDADMDQHRRLSQKAAAVIDQMKIMRDLPFKDRKKNFRDLALEYHPDKNNDPDAKEIFVAINNSRSWFLTEEDRNAKD